MKTARITGIIVTALGLFGAAAQTNQSGTPSAAPEAAPAADNGLSAMRRASEAKQYLFAFVYEKDDEATRAARKAFEAAVAKVTPEARSVVTERGAPAEKEMVEKLGLQTAPVPIVLAIAPNGAVTGSIKGSELTEQSLRDAVASPALQQCLKAIQDGQLVVVCLQNEKTKANEAAMKGVNEIKTDGWYSETTEVIEVDPSDPKEAKLVAQLKADPKTKRAATVVLAPPAVLVTKIDGATSKEGLKAAFKKAAEGCSGKPGCCSPAPK
jgi:predicted secreted protein